MTMTDDTALPTLVTHLTIAYDMARRVTTLTSPEYPGRAVKATDESLVRAYAAARIEATLGGPKLKHDLELHRTAMTLVFAYPERYDATMFNQPTTSLGAPDATDPC